MKFKKPFVLGLFVLGLLSGCASKKDITDQTALYWHNAIYKDLNNMNLDAADDEFTSLEIEHPNSQFVPIDLLILSKAHLENDEYQLAEFYMDEYAKRYANKYEKEWADYQKVKIRFFSLINPYTNQKKVYQTLKFVNTILDKYPDSIYNYELTTIKRKLEVTQIVFDNRISDLYKRLDKPKASEFYKRETKESIIYPEIPWYKKLFYW